VNTPAAPRIDAEAVRATLRAAGLRARHSLSQNFLADPDVLEAILAEADPAPGRRVLEIGPGLGLLTAGLLAGGADVTAVELDRGLAAFLRERFDGVEALRLIEGDALDQDLVGLVPPPYDVVANLPYHITSPILHALLGAPPRPETAHPDGPARGGRTHRGAAREDELPVGLRPVPRPGPDRAHGPGRRLRTRARRRIRRHRRRALRRGRPPRAPRPRPSCGGWSRPHSASVAR